MVDESFPIRKVLTLDSQLNPSKAHLDLLPREIALLEKLGK